MSDIFSKHSRDRRHRASGNRRGQEAPRTDLPVIGEEDIPVSSTQQPKPPARRAGRQNRDTAALAPSAERKEASAQPASPKKETTSFLRRLSSDAKNAKERKPVTRSDRMRAARGTAQERPAALPESETQPKRHEAVLRTRQAAEPKTARARAAQISDAEQPEQAHGRSAAIRQRRSQGGSVLKPGLTSMARPVGRRDRTRLGSEHSTHVSSQPPVLARGGMAGLSAPAKPGRAPRRRYDIALNVPGAEVRLPALPEVRFGWRLASGTLAVMMLTLLYMMFGTPFFQVKSVTVNGLQRLTSLEVNQVLGLAGESIFAIDPRVLQDRLDSAFPELASVELSIGLPHEVILNLVERTPVVAWVQDGQELWVDAEGVSFPPKGELDAETVLPRVEANGLPPGTERTGVRQDLLKLDPELVTTILTMRSYLPEGSAVVYSPERGFGWHDDRGWDAYLGQRIEQIDQKLVTYQALVEAMIAQGIRPSLVSVEYLHAPYYRVER